MTNILLHILCWVGVVYFIVRLYKFFVLIGRSLVRIQKSSVQKIAQTIK